MSVEQLVRGLWLDVEECGACGGAHSLPIELVVDRDVDVMGMVRPAVKKMEHTLVCPVEQVPIVVKVPVDLEVGETLVATRTVERA